MIAGIVRNSCKYCRIAINVYNNSAVRVKRAGIGTARGLLCERHRVVCTAVSVYIAWFVYLLVSVCFYRVTCLFVCVHILVYVSFCLFRYLFAYAFLQGSVYNWIRSSRTRVLKHRSRRRDMCCSDAARARLST